MLAILSTHPIQYQVPIWRGLAARGDVPFKVFYLNDQGLRASFDPGFGHALAWDIDLLAGYPHEFIDARVGPRQDRFDWLQLPPGFIASLRAQGFTTLWIQGWQVRAYWQAARQARGAGQKLWLRAESNLRSNRGGVAQKLKWMILRRLLDRVDRFLAIGTANREFYLRLGYPESKISLAPYCVDNARFEAQTRAAAASRAQLREKWGVPPDAFCFLSVGKFIPKKRPLDLAAAAGRLHREGGALPVHVLWVGTGQLEGALRDACSVRYSPEVGLQPVSPQRADLPPGSFAGFLNQSEIAEAYAAADALVLPSDAKETWGLVVNEAMASGLPCVVSAECGCAEDLVAPLRPDLCFPVGDINALTASMRSVMLDAPSAEAVRAHVAAFDVSRTVRAAAELFLAKD